MSEHTKEPWAVTDEWIIRVPDADDMGMQIADVDGLTIREAKANARRIVACVNACRGISTEELEQHGVTTRIPLVILRKADYT